MGAGDGGSGSFVRFMTCGSCRTACRKHVTTKNIEKLYFGHKMDTTHIAFDSQESFALFEENQ